MANQMKSDNLKTYDVAVVGTGPAGRRAAMECVREGKRTLVVDRRHGKIGGVSLHVGTIPSKTLREAVLDLSGLRQSCPDREGARTPGGIKLEQLMDRVNSIVAREQDMMKEQLNRSGLDVLFGEASFEDAHTMVIYNRCDKQRTMVKADRFILATGTVPRHPSDVPFDHEVIFDSNFMFCHKSRMKVLPRSLLVVGGGVIGSEYAAMFAALGCEVTLVDKSEHLLGFLDSDIGSLLLHEIGKLGVHMVLGRGYERIERTPDGRGVVITDRGERLEADVVLFSLGRIPCVDPLKLENAGVELGERNTIAVDDSFQTSVPHIYAAGDVIGFPALASTSSEQGRIAARCAMGYTVRDHRPELFPFAIYTIPEASIIGKSEQVLKRMGIQYEVGIARFDAVSKATIKGVGVGMLKLLFDPESWQLLGVHVVGEQAAELIHIGQTAMALGGRMDFFIHNVFNYPTWAEAYRLAALDGLSRLSVPSRVHTGNQP